MRADIPTGTGILTICRDRRELLPLARYIVISALSLIRAHGGGGAIVLWPSYSDHPIPTQFRAADGSITTVDAGSSSSSGRTVSTPERYGPGHRRHRAGERGCGPVHPEHRQTDIGGSTREVHAAGGPDHRAQSGKGPDSMAVDKRTLDDPQPGQPTLHVGDKIRSRPPRLPTAVSATDSSTSVAERRRSSGRSRSSRRSYWSRRGVACDRFWG